MITYIPEFKTSPKLIIFNIIFISKRKNNIIIHGLNETILLPNFLTDEIIHQLNTGKYKCLYSSNPYSGLIISITNEQTFNIPQMFNQSLFMINNFIKEFTFSEFSRYSPSRNLIRRKKL